MAYIYIDESGDLGFDFEYKNPSQYFTLTLIYVRDMISNKALKKEIEVTLKRKLNTKKKKSRIVSEIKGSKTDIEIKKYLFKRIAHLNFSIYSITFHKRKIHTNLQNNPSRLYNYFVRQIIDQVDFSEISTHLTVVLDKSKNKEQILDCNTYLIKNIEAKLPLNIQLDIIHEKSELIKQLQIADVFCYGFYEKYNKGTVEWYNVFKQKILYDQVWFDNAED